MKRWIIAAALALVAASAAWWYGSSLATDSKPEQTHVATSETPSRDQTAVPVRTQTAARRNITQSLEVHGTLEPFQDVAVTPKVSGLIDRIHVDVGDRVRKDDVLAELDDDEYRIRYDQAYASVQAAEANVARLRAGTRPEEIEQAQAQVTQAAANLEQASAHLARIRSLHEAGAVPQAELEAAETQHQVAQAQLEAARSRLQLAKEGPLPQDIDAAEAQLAQARAGLKLARLQLDYAQITAPIDGLVAGRFADPGDLAAPGNPLFRIVQVDPVQVRVELGGRDVVKVKAGQEVVLQVDAFPGETFPGAVSVVEAVADSRSRLFGVRISVPNPGGRLRPGMSGAVTIVVSEVEGVLALPDEALLSDGEGTYVYVVQNGVARRKSVVAGLSGQGWTEIVSGLSQGEEVIVSGHSFIKDGTPVRVQGREGA